MEDIKSNRTTQLHALQKKKKKKSGIGASGNGELAGIRMLNTYETASE